MLDKQRGQRPIRSYVLRQGRITAGQQRAFNRLWPRFGIEFCGQRLNLPSLFGNQHPVWLEIGFGNGESLAQLAMDNPSNNYLGIEVHRPGVGHLLIRMEALALSNIRLIHYDAVEVISDGLHDNSLAGALLLFPDPWHKKRHHKRRILQPQLVKELARTIRSGGLLHTATDWQPYADYMLQVMSQADTDFENIAGNGRFHTRPKERPLTKFEQRGIRLQHKVRDLIFRRR